MAFRAYGKLTKKEGGVITFSSADLNANPEFKGQMEIFGLDFGIMKDVDANHQPQGVAKPYTLSVWKPVDSGSPILMSVAGKPTKSDKNRSAVEHFTAFEVSYHNGNKTFYTIKFENLCLIDYHLTKPNTMGGKDGGLPDNECLVFTYRMVTEKHIDAGTQGAWDVTQTHS